MRIAILLLATATAYTQTTPNFTGVWELNKAKSLATGQMPDAMKVKIEQQGSRFVVTFRTTSGGKLEQDTQTYVVGETSKSAMHGAPMTSQAEWEAGTLVVKSVAMFGNQQLKMTDRWTLSADGNTLTFRERHQFAAEPEAEDARTFDRNPAGTWEPDERPKLAEEVYKNIRVMKGMPATRLQPLMVSFSEALGVQCGHCHTVGQFEKDDVAAKAVARQMIQMVHTINDDSFKESRQVSCWMCHHGLAKPERAKP